MCAVVDVLIFMGTYWHTYRIPEAIGWEQDPRRLVEIGPRVRLRFFGGAGSCDR